MRRVFTLVAVAIAAAFVVSGCNSSVENKYEDGRADQKAKAHKMIEDNSE